MWKCDAMREGDVLGRITLVTGTEEFLNERTVHAVREPVRATDAEAELTETNAADLSLATLGELAAPSLFSRPGAWSCGASRTCPTSRSTGILGYAAAPVDDVALVLVHGGGQKGTGMLTKLRKLAGVTEVKSEALKPSEFSRLRVRRGPHGTARHRQRRRRRARRGGRPGPSRRCRRPPTS